MLSVTDKAISLVLLKTFANLCHTVKPLITVTNFYSLKKKKISPKKPVLVYNMFLYTTQC